MTPIERIQLAVDKAACSSSCKAKVSIYGKQFIVSVNYNRLLTPIRMELLEPPYYVARGITPLEVYSTMQRYIPNWY